MKIALSAESTIDLPKNLLEEYGISVLPYTVLLGEKSYLDGDITPDDIFEYVDETGQVIKAPTEEIMVGYKVTISNDSGYNESVILYTTISPLK